jgi:membrane protease YdiL (CAAX protease family)
VLWEVALLWLATLLAIRAVTTIAPMFPAARLGSGVLSVGLQDVVLAAVPFLFIYTPVWLCRRRGVDSYAYRVAVPAFDDGPAWRESIAIVAKLVTLIVLPWLVGYHLYQWLLFGYSPAPCLPPGLAEWFPPRTAHDGGGLCLPKDAALLVPFHLFFVAIPEEFFYRGYLQTRLNEIFPRKWIVFGVPIGWGAVLACLFFAFGHSLVQLRWWHFATFFPGLVFAWLRERTGGPAAGALFHAWCNVVVQFLDAAWGVSG